MGLVKSVRESIVSSFRRVYSVARVPYWLVWLLVRDYRERRRWPKNVDEAVERLLEMLTPESKEVVRGCPADDLPLLDLRLGLTVRNRFGLWQGNKALLRSCGSEDLHPDGASGVIIYRLWERLRGYQEPTANPAGGGPGVREPKAE